MTNSVRPDALTGLRIFVHPNTIRRAAAEFADHFATALADFRAGETSTLTRQLYGMFRHAEPADEFTCYPAFVSQITAAANLPSPEFHFRRRHDILFVCYANRTNVTRTGEADPQLVVSQIYRLNTRGEPILRAAPSRFANARNR